MKPNLSDHLKRSGQIIEQNAKNAPVKDIKWEGQEIESERFEIKDPGVGQPVILRTFEFKINPALPKNIKPTKQDLFKYHEQMIKTMLWSDGMTILDEKKPKVQISKHQNKYRIFVLCMPREVLLDKPLTL
jgi:hypothetical protein